MFVCSADGLFLKGELKPVVLQAMGLFLPQPPPPDSDEEEDPDGEAACRSRASIPMDAGGGHTSFSLNITHTLCLY